MIADFHGDLGLWVANSCSFVAALGVVYLALAAILILQFKEEPRRAAPGRRPVSILVPLCGEDEQLYERLSALCRQDYCGSIEVICGLQDANDPAIGIVNAVAAKFSGMRVALRIDPKQHGANRKISNLINTSASARAGIVVLVDSDILVGPGHLSIVVGELERPGVGAVTCLYHGVSGAGFWSSLSALSINANFLPSVVMALTFGIARPCSAPPSPCRVPPWKASAGSALLLIASTMTMPSAGAYGRPATRSRSRAPRLGMCAAKRPRER